MAPGVFNPSLFCFINPFRVSFFFFFCKNIFSCLTAWSLSDNEQKKMQEEHEMSDNTESKGSVNTDVMSNKAFVYCKY